MAKGREKHEARVAEIGLLGKDLARRASQRCELCEGKDDLRVYDTAPDEEPTLDTLALLCARCRGLAEGKREPQETLRFLESAIWSPHPGVASVARAALARVDAGWARMALEMLS